jgi:hypothetical protein
MKGRALMAFVSASYYLTVARTDYAAAGTSGHGAG